MRVPGDIIFGIGALAIGVFMVGLLTGWSLKSEASGEVEAGSPIAVPESDAIEARSNAAAGPDEGEPV